MPIKESGMVKFVPARLIRRLSNPRHVKELHKSGHFPVITLKGKTFVLQPMKIAPSRQQTEKYPRTINEFSQTRNLAQDTGRGTIIVSKGTGAIGKNGQFFSYCPEEKIWTRRFWGGMTIDEAPNAKYFSNLINRKYAEMARKRTPAMTIAREYGVDKAPTMEFISTTRPTMHVYRVHLSEVPSLLKNPLITQQEKKAIGYEAKRAAERGDEDSTINIALKKGLKIMEIPNEVAKKAAVINYRVRTNTRVRDSARTKDISAEIIGASGLQKKGDAWFAGNNKLSIESAKNYAINRFAASIGLAMRIMHKDIRATFSYGEYSAMEWRNVTIAGEIVDLDTCNTGDSTKPFADNKQEDFANAKRNMVEMIRLLWGLETEHGAGAKKMEETMAILNRVYNA